MCVVDCGIRVNTPELRHGVTRSLTTNVDFFNVISMIFHHEINQILTPNCNFFRISGVI